VKQNLALINELLSRPRHIVERRADMGDYCLGVVSALAERDGIVAPESLLRAAVVCKSPGQAADLLCRISMRDRSNQEGVVMLNWHHGKEKRRPRFHAGVFPAPRRAWRQARGHESVREHDAGATQGASPEGRRGAQV